MPEASAGYSAFISYAKADQKKAHEIAASLEERGFKCWIAPRDVRAGRSYGDEIIRGIERSRCFILVLSEASNESAFVAREVERAVSKKKPVFPVRVDNVEPAPSLELFISGTQWIDAFSGKLSSHMDRMAAMLADDGADDGPSPLTKPAPPLPSLLKRRPASLRLAALALGILVVASSAYMYFSFGPRHTDTDAATDRDFQDCDTGAGDTALAACERAISSGRFAGHNLSLLYNDRGYMRMLRGELDAAFADLEEAIQIDPKNFFAYWNRGAVYAANRDFDRAKADYEKALALNPDDDSRKKIEAALSTLASAAPKAASDPLVLTDPNLFMGNQPEASSPAAAEPPPVPVPVPPQ